MSKKNNKDDFLKNLEKKLRKQGDFRDKSSKGQQDPNQSQRGGRFTFFLFIALLVATLLFFNQNKNSSERQEVSYSQFIKEVKEKAVNEVLIINESTIEYAKDGIKYSTRIPYVDMELVSRLIDSGVVVHSEQREDSPFFIIFVQWFPWIILMVFFWFIISRQLKGRGGEAFSFGKSKAQMINSDDIKERFSDVKGCEESIVELKDIVSFLKDPVRFSNLGARIPKGVLLVGAPGTGKTLLAKAVAGEAKVPFFSMSGSDFVEMFVGVGASRVRDLFVNGKRHAPCIIFIDEIDAVGRTRGSGYGGGHDEREQTLNQLLVEMDGFGTEQGIILMAATNRPDVLDKALLRPGRFDRQVVVDAPDLKGRKAILEVHAKKVKVDKNVDFDALARGTSGLTGADLANIINEAALVAAKEQKPFISTDDFEMAKDKVMLGTERRSIFISQEERRNTAFHEAGHALVALLLDAANRLHKVSIIPRGRALGLTYFLPEDGRLTMRRSHAEAELRVLYGGRVAEEIIFKDITNGAFNDIERATKIARAMVCEWGFSKLGAVAFDEKRTGGYLSPNQYESAPAMHSEELTKKIDSEVRSILNDAYADAKKILKKNIGKLNKLANALLEKETLTVEEVGEVLKIKMKKRLENFAT